MKKANESAFPAIHFPTQQAIQQAEGAGLSTPQQYTTGGLSKLEYAAIEAMKGLLSSMDPQTSQATGEEIAAMAVSTAKTLLAELEKES